MNGFFSRNGFVVIALLLIAAGMALYGAYMQDQNQGLAREISAVQNQVASLAEALQLTATTTEGLRQQIAQVQQIASRPQPAQRSADEVLTSVVSGASPAVVSIVVSKDVPLLQIQYVNPFGDNPAYRDIPYRVPTFRQIGTEQQEVGAGTGFLIRSDGYILTNRHVVSDEDAEYTVLLSSGQKRTARVVYRDQTNDMAIIKIDGTGYTALPLGDSSAVKLGQAVVAIGNALGEYSNSVSTGIISGLNRTIQARDADGSVETLSGMIQTDAAVNRGNSGGPLLDLAGRAVGVNVAIQQGASNIAFSIPVNTLRPVINRILP